MTSQEMLTLALANRRLAASDVSDTARYEALSEIVKRSTWGRHDVEAVACEELARVGVTLMEGVQHGTA